VALTLFYKRPSAPLRASRCPARARALRSHDATGFQPTAATASRSLLARFSAILQADEGRRRSSELVAILDEFSALPPLFCHILAALLPFDRADRKGVTWDWSWGSGS
jgi:hypothetical protein